MSNYRHIEFCREGRHFVVRLLDLGPSNDEEVLQAVAEWNSVADRADCHALCVDCSSIHLLSSEMVCKLISLQRRLNRKEAKLVLRGLHSDARAVLRWTRLDQVFAIEEEAPQEAATAGDGHCPQPAIGSLVPPVDG
jgi:anti-anti-sigma regulatory factor